MFLIKVNLFVGKLLWTFYVVYIWHRPALFLEAIFANVFRYSNFYLSF